MWKKQKYTFKEKKEKKKKKDTNSSSAGQPILITEKALNDNPSGVPVFSGWRPYGSSETALSQAGSIASGGVRATTPPIGSSKDKPTLDRARRGKARYSFGGFPHDSFQTSDDTPNASKPAKRSVPQMPPRALPPLSTYATTADEHSGSDVTQLTNRETERHNESVTNQAFSGEYDEIGANTQDNLQGSSPKQESIQGSIGDEEVTQSVSEQETAELRSEPDSNEDQQAANETIDIPVDLKQDKKAGKKRINFNRSKKSRKSILDDDYPGNPPDSPPAPDVFTLHGTQGGPRDLTGGTESDVITVNKGKKKKKKGRSKQKKQEITSVDQEDTESVPVVLKLQGVTGDEDETGQNDDTNVENTAKSRKNVKRKSLIGRSKKNKADTPDNVSSEEVSLNREAASPKKKKVPTVTLR